MTSDAVLREPGSTHGAATLTGQITSAELRSGDLLGGRFRIESLLGVGGMGVVYRARDLSLDIDVALKLLRPELARKPDAFERFRKELLLARQVSSPHVVRIHDEAWIVRGDRYPWQGAGLEPLSKHHTDWKRRYATIFTRS